MFKVPFVLVISLFSFSANAQHVSLYWYNLQSLQPLSQEEGKIVVVLISELTEDSLLTFNVKSSMFLLAAKSPIVGDLLASSLNSAGYFIADVTGGIVHQEGAVKSGFNFQAALFYFGNQDVFIVNGFETIGLNDREILLLQDEYSLDPLQFPQFKFEEH